MFVVVVVVEVSGGELVGVGWVDWYLQWWCGRHMHQLVVVVVGKSVVASCC